MKTNLNKLLSLAIVLFTVGTLHAQTWNLTGNAGTIPGTNFIGTIDSKALYLKTNSNTRIAVTSSGKVGIGTTAPTAKLQVEGLANASEVFRISNDKNTTKDSIMVMTSNGNVGIGTAAPSANLHVKGIIKVEGIAGSGINFNEIYSPTFFTHSITHMHSNGSDVNNALMFNISNGSGITNQVMLLNGAGNLGIGTSVPYARLHVNGDIKQQGSGGITFCEIGLPTSYLHSITHIHSAGSSVNNALMFNISDGSGVTNQIMVLNGGGNVGIGTSAPYTKLHVVGSRNDGQSIAIIENTANNTLGYCDGLHILAGQNAMPINYSSLIDFKRPDGTSIGVVAQGSATSVIYGTTSDLRLKTNIKDTKYGLSTILNIKAVDYNFKTDLNSIQTGFIAQQLYEQFPDAVCKGGEDPKTRPWMVDYGRLTPILVKAIQEQQNQIIELKSCIEILCENSTIKNSSFAVNSESTRLFQNQPNPFNQTCIIRFALSAENNSGFIIIRDLKGNLVKEISISNTGKGQVTVNANELKQGTYTYSLEIAGESIDTKLMVITK